MDFLFASAVAVGIILYIVLAIAKREMVFVSFLVIMAHFAVLEDGLIAYNFCIYCLLLPNGILLYYVLEMFFSVPPS